MKRTALALLLLTACEPELGKVVAVVSDSIVTRTLEELHTKAAARDRGDLIVPVASLPFTALGRDLAYFTERIESAIAHGQPIDAVVVSLGTNDTSDIEGELATWHLVDTHDELSAAIDALLGSLPPVPVIWVLPASPLSPYFRAQHFRTTLELARERWPQLTLLTPEPGWYVGTNADALHWSLEGELEAAQAIVSALDAMEQP